MSWPSTLDVFRSLEVLVIGDAMLDVYLHGHSSRLCPEAPVPVVDVSSRCHVAGGAANTAVNLRDLGASVTLLTLAGDDCEGLVLRQELARHGVHTGHWMALPERQTLAKQRVLSGSQILLRFDQGDTQPPDATAQRALAARLDGLYDQFDAVIVSDYGYGTCSPRVIETLAARQRKTPRVLIGDSKRLDKFKVVHFSAVKPNYGEALALLGESRLPDESRIDRMLHLGPRLLELIQSDMVAVTMDRDGALVFESGAPPLRTLTAPNPHSHAAGAGDTYAAALALSLAAGAAKAEAAEIAAAAAAVVVTKEGTSSCTWHELLRRLKGREMLETDLDALLPKLDAYRQLRRRIVLTSGCFDLLHRGHITYLRQARSLGDVLVVGVNSDESIRRLKGPERPINTVEDRLQVLAALHCVDHVVVFNEDTPHRLVQAVRPDVFVKGGDYTRDRLPEAALVEQLGGRVEILPLVEERSTTSIIKRIRGIPAAANGRSASVGVSTPLPLPASLRVS